MNPLNINQQITWVYTEDLDTTAAFYGSQLGLALTRDEGAAKIFRVSASASIGVCIAFDDRVVEPAGSMITFVTDEVDAWHQTLEARGVTISKPPHVLEKFGIYTFFAEDPNGYAIEFQQFL